jgi:hypothetical protein
MLPVRPDHFTVSLAIMQDPAFIHLKCYRGGTVLSKENVTEERAVTTEEKMTIDERRKYLRLM